MNFSIAGSGTLTGGDYDKVSLSGSTKLRGEVRCASLHANGSFGGSGSIDCSGEMRMNGAVNIDGALSAREVRTAGALKCGGIKGEKVSLAGAAGVESDIEAEELRIRGAVKCGGLINADRIDIVFDSRSRAQSIGGSSISVKVSIEKKGFFGRLFKLGDCGEMTVDEGIEGDDIYLENVTSPRVVGKNVTIGRGCRIGEVQYSESLEVSPETVVENTEQI